MTLPDRPRLINRMKFQGISRATGTLQGTAQTPETPPDRRRITQGTYGAGDSGSGVRRRALGDAALVGAGAPESKQPGLRAEGPSKGLGDASPPARRQRAKRFRPTNRPPWARRSDIPQNLTPSWGLRSQPGAFSSRRFSPGAGATWYYHLAAWQPSPPSIGSLHQLKAVRQRLGAAPAFRTGCLIPGLCV